MMGAEGSWGMVRPPTVAPLNFQRREHWKHFDDSGSAVSFGILATAILISMFLLLAIFERFLRRRSTESRARTRMDLEEQMVFGGKLEHPSPKGWNDRYAHMAATESSYYSHLQQSMGCSYFTLNALSSLNLINMMNSS